ncbi:hypothetical protein H1230_19465 [Paenibacillus sp. 19GGS1-52]|uniref:hypothetical protein n=1 Tax=Paenibacillus sp. 19GGS1-52 TaxID=2758563 RepID=UPI001EFA731F|nr:hypothetical protein [Paenibacillus sp. 19GGS1-52]ULO05280.1 hypothetical protein H1230_19465 [Paenibacillus sp. 19GGS1-52]
MAILLPQQFFDLAPNVGKSYYENLAGGINAAVTVQNFSALNPVSLVLTRVNAPVVTYVIPPLNSLTIASNKLLVAALLSGAGAVTGTIEVATSDF